MALRPDWVIGTVTLTSGSKNFTIAGASLALGQWRVGDAIIRTGRMLIIDTLATNGLTGTLAENCPADAAGAAVPLRIRYQSEGSRDQAMVQALAVMIDQGLLPGLAGLVPSANQMPYLDLSGAAALTPLTPFARTLLDDADAAAIWTTLGATSPADVAFRRGNILGAVSQSGGVPTGAVIQRGSNASGEFVRFADGTQICSVLIEAGSIVFGGTGTRDDPFRTNAFSGTWAAGFIATPFVSVTPVPPFDLFVATYRQAIGTYRGATAGSYFDVQAVRPVSNNNVTLFQIAVIAIGRWF